MSGMRGIDVSAWNGAIDWIKTASAGVKFAMIRAGTGQSTGGFTRDVRFRENLTGAAAAGLSCGAYLFSYARSVRAAQIEAERTAEFLLPYRERITFPVAYDIENSGQAALGKRICTDMANAFCEVLRAAGFVPMVYSFYSFLTDSMYPRELTADVWLAHFASKTDYAGAYTIRQYSDHGSVEGITGRVDLDVCTRDYAVGEETEAAIGSLASAGALASPEYWRDVAAGRREASRQNIGAMLRKWADCVKKLPETDTDGRKE